MAANGLLSLIHFESCIAGALDSCVGTRRMEVSISVVLDAYHSNSRDARKRRETTAVQLQIHAAACSPSGPIRSSGNLFFSAPIVFMFLLV